MEEKKSFLEKANSKNIAFFSIIVIFGILLLQSAFSLFVELKFEELGQIDTVFRTALSSIFGYIMSMVSTSDFMLQGKRVSTSQKPTSIGFATSDQVIPKAVIYNDTADTPTTEAITEVPKTASLLGTNKILAVNIQIIVLAAVCVFCLLSMLIVRNFSEMIVSNSSNIVTISMYRDIISGSIGALIGLSRTTNS